MAAPASDATLPASSSSSASASAGWAPPASSPQPVGGAADDLDAGGLSPTQSMTVPSTPAGQQRHASDLWGVTLRLLSARQLRAADLFTRSSDPYARLDIDGVERRSRVVKRSTAPHWQQSFTWTLSRPPRRLKVKVFDWDAVGAHDKLGWAELDLSSVGEQWAGELKLQGVKSGSVELSVSVASIPDVVGQSSAALDGIAAMEDVQALVEVKIVGAERLGGRAAQHHLLKARNDPFATLTFGLHSFKTSVVPANNDPTWNQLVPLWITRSGHNAKALIKLSVWDHDRIGEADLLGSAYLRPADLEPNRLYDVKLPLTRHAAHTDAQLNVLLQDMAAQLAAPSAVAMAMAEKATGLHAAPSTPAPSLHPKQEPDHGLLHVHIIVKPRDQVEREFYAQLLADYDQDGNQRMSLEELTHMMAALDVPISAEDLQAAFEEADKDKAGSLGVEELATLFRTPQFQSKSALRALYAVIIHGTAAMHTLLMRGCLTDSHSTLVTAEDNPTSVDNDGTQILVQDRETGLLVRENIPGYIKSALVLLNRTRVGKLASGKIKGTIRKLTIRAGEKMNSPESRHDIPNFVRIHRLNLAEVEKPVSEYATFNEFFYRRLKPGARVCALPDDVAHAVSPADCRLCVFPSVDAATRLWIKGRNFTIPNLLADWDVDGSKAALFNGGAIAIARLAPQDYHRFHHPVTGRLQKRHLIPGDYQTVSPIAVRKDVDVYTMNKRVIVPIETAEFGLVLLIAIAATLVGGIGFECTCTLKPHGAPCCDDGRCQVGRQVHKFSDCGWFAFGGSTTLLLFQPGSIEFDSDLSRNSAQQLETLVKVGSSLGRATGKYKKQG